MSNNRGASYLRRYDLKDLQEFVGEAQEIASVWRSDSWIDCMMYDGDQWSDLEYNVAVNAGIDPLTINRIFPTVNLLLGLQVVNKYNIGTEGRTHMDAEISQIMDEGIQFIMDQCGGGFLIQQAHKDQIIPGIGFLHVCHSNDPRDEKIQVVYRDWKEMWWDPFGDPWLNPKSCRYVFFQRWLDLIDLQAQYPDKAKELGDYMAGITAHSGGSGMGDIWYDDAQKAEELKLIFGGGGTNRKRVRPTEMWYTVYEKGLWAKFKNGRVTEVPSINADNSNAKEIYDIITNAHEFFKAVVPKMWTTTFLGDIVLDDSPTPYSHDLYPFAPLISYLDRLGFPFGVPRQLQGQQIEINKRRSMALALLKKRRVITESGIVENQQDLEKVWEEANKPDGFIVVKPGMKDKIEIIEGATLVAPQMEILRDSEREIQQISGANAELHGQRTDASSGVAIQERINQSATIVAPLAENLRRGMHTLGKLLVAEIQGEWTGEKVLRVTDKLTLAKRFVVLNERVPDWRNGEVTVKNDITQGMFDIVISEAPATATVREQNMNLIIEAVKKSPPDIIPQMLTMAFEISNLPNKDQIVAKMQTLYNINPMDADTSPEEMKQRVIQELEAQKANAQKQAAYEEQLKNFTLEKAKLENDKLKAEINKIIGATSAEVTKANAQKDKVGIEGFKAGFDIQNRMNEEKKAEFEILRNSLVRQQQRERTVA